MGSTEAPDCFDQQADSRTEARQSTFSGARALRKDQHVEAAIHGLAGVGKAGLEVALPGERKDVEERRDEQISERAEERKAAVGSGSRKWRKSSSISPDMATANCRRIGPGRAYWMNGPS